MQQEFTALQIIALRPHFSIICLLAPMNIILLKYCKKNFILFFLMTVNDDQQDATILAYLFIPNQLYMFRAMSSPIIRST